MPNPARLDLVHKAICSGVYGHIQWNDAAARRLRANPLAEELTPEGIRAMLRQFVLDGHTLDARAETRAEYLEENPDDPWWYRAVIAVPELTHGLFVEVKLIDDDPKEPWVEIVSVHAQQP